MEIYLGVVDEQNPPENYRNYVWLGRCCQKGILWSENNKREYQVFDNEWLDDQKIQQNEQYLKKIKSELLVYATNELNCIHDTNYTTRNWKVLLSQWMNLYIISFYDKYLKLKRVMQLGMDCEVALYKTTKAMAILDGYDYINKMEDDEFHRYQYSLLIEQMPQLKKQLKIIWREYRGSVPKIVDASKPEYVKIFEESYRNYKDQIKIEDDVVIQNPYIKFTLYKEIMEMAPGKISGYLKNYFGEIRKDMPLIVNNELRNSANHEETSMGDEFTRIMYKLFMRSLPIAYLEDFQYLKRISDENYKYARNPKAVIFEAGGIYYDEMFKIYLMNVVDTEAVKISVQHGGGNGLWRDMQFDEEYGSCDIFWTCGWEADVKKPYFEKMPFLKFFRLKEVNRKYNCNEGRILYASNLGNKYPFRFTYYDLKSAEYMSAEIDFLNYLNSKVKSKMKVRLYDVNASYGWLYGDLIKQKVKDLIFDTNSYFYKSLSEANLFIAEIFTTPAIEAMYMDIPTLVLYGPGYFDIRKENFLFKEIQALVDVGIIAETPKKLAETINEIHDCVEEWWNDPIRQEAINEFKKKYLYFPENSEQIWKEKIYGYVSDEYKHQEITEK